MSTILTYEVLGSALETLMNLKKKYLLKFYGKFNTDIVVRTSITVRFTVMIASKKKGLK